MVHSVGFVVGHVQVPAVHVPPAAQMSQALGPVLPHAFSSVCVSVQMPHAVLFGGSQLVLQRPPEQNWFVPQLRPQMPQSVTGVPGVPFWRLRHVPLQLRSLGGQQMLGPVPDSGGVEISPVGQQIPSLQTWPLPHGMLQPPQWATLFCVSMQVPPQFSSFAPVQQTPLSQVPAHVSPHAPQLFSSLSLSTQAPLQLS
jgi:hypothetical protein